LDVWEPLQEVEPGGAVVTESGRDRKVARRVVRRGLREEPPCERVDALGRAADADRAVLGEIHLDRHGRDLRVPVGERGRLLAQPRVAAARQLHRQERGAVGRADAGGEEVGVVGPALPERGIERARAAKQFGGGWGGGPACVELARALLLELLAQRDQLLLVRARVAAEPFAAAAPVLEERRARPRRRE